MVTTRSGLPRDQPSGHSGVGGKSFSLPFGAPVLTHFWNKAISFSESLRSWAKLFFCGSGIQGGIWRDVITSEICSLCFETSSYVSREKGALCPGRWHTEQFLKTMGAMSRENVGARSISSEWLSKLEKRARKGDCPRKPGHGTKRPN